jgi:hypothetical protein
VPVTYRIVTAVGLVHSRFDGVVTFEEAFETNRRLCADTDFDPSMKQLSDARTATSAMTGQSIRTLAKYSPFGPGSRRAVLVADADTFGVTRMYEAQADEAGEVQIFEDEEAALEWLGVDPEALKSS